MPAQIYDKGRERYARGLGNWETDTLTMYMVSDIYVFDPAHTDISDIPPESVIDAEPVPFELRDGVDGYLNGAAVTFPNVQAVNVVVGLIIAADNTLVLFSDDAQGLPKEVFPGNFYIVQADPLFNGFGRL